MLEIKYGIPWIKISFLGPKSTAQSLRKIAAYFEDQELIDTVEKVIAEEMVPVEAKIKEIKPRCEGKTAMMFVGGSRAHHYQELFWDLGMKVLSAGYEFAHRDDYEGRQVIPDIKIDADSRNIEELEIEPDETRYNPRKTEGQMKALEEKGFQFKAYEGMIPDMAKGSLIVDDISHHETETLIEMYKPDIFCAGIKEKYAVQKHGIPMKQLHSYDSGGPYAVFKGAINFYEEIDRMLNANIWHYLEAPWQKAPELSGKYAAE
jgi:nitrogenase molybdenum-iron protein alpha chain